MDGIEGAGKTIGAIVSLIALVPGVAVFANVVPLPPELKTLLGGVGVLVSFVAVVLIFLNGEKLKQLSTKNASVALGAATALAVVLGLSLYFLADDKVITIEENGAAEVLVLPLSQSEALRDALRPHGGDYAGALLSSYSAAHVRELIDQENGGTKLLLSILFLLTQALFVAAVVAGVSLLNARNAGSGGAPPAAAAGQS
jgi:hypothetical protein